MSHPSARRWTRRIAIFGTGLLTLVVAVLALLQVPPVATWVMRRLVNVVPLNRGYGLEVGSVTGDWLHQLTLDDVRLVRQGRELARVDRLQAHYDLRQVRGSQPRLQELTVDGARLTASRKGDSWDLADALRRSADTSKAAGGGFTLERLTLRDVELIAQLAPDSALRVRGLNLQARNLVLGPEVLVQVDQLNAAVAPPGSAQWFAVATRGSVTPDELALDGVVPLAGKRADYRLQGTVRRLDPASLLEAAPPGNLNGTIEAEVRGPTLSRADGRVELRLNRSRLAGKSVQRLALRADLRRGSALVALRGTIERGTVNANGRVRPFDSIPEYRLRGAATGLPGTEAVARTLAGDEGEPVLDVQFQLNGAGFSTTDGRLSGRVELTAVREDGERAALGHSTVALANGRLDAHPELYVGHGTVTADVIARLGDTVSYEVRRGTIDRVNLAELTADTALAPVTGRFSLRGRGIAPAEAVASARIELDSLQYGGRSLEQVTGSARLASGRARIDFGSALQGGRLAVDANARPFGKTKTFTLRRASLEKVDLGTFLGRPDLAGPITLHASGSGRFRGEVRSFRGQLTVEPSKLGDIEVTRGSVAVTLSGERLSYDGTIRTNGGTVALAGDGRPFGDAPSFAIRKGRADSLDLGTLLGRPD